MIKRGELRLLLLVLSLIFSSLLIAVSVYASDYVAKVQVSAEKSFYGPNEEMHVAGSVFLSNLSANDTSFVSVSGASVNFSISNASSNGSALQAQYILNTSADGSFSSRSDLVPSGIQVKAPAGEGYYNFSMTYLDPNNVEWRGGGVLRVFASAIDHVSISPASARYYAGDAVVITLGAIKDVGDKEVALANVTINGSMRYTNRTTISAFSCVTQNEGTCTASVTAPGTAGTYLLEANNFLSMSSFLVVPFEAFVYVKDSTGTSFKEILKGNEVATIETKVTANGSLPTGAFVFNGTITDSSSKVIANITSTSLESNNSYTNRFSFTVSNAFTNGIYFVSVTVYQTSGGSGKASASSSFQVRSWSLTANKATGNSGFEYEYAAFANRTVSFEVYPKDSQNGTVITNINNTQFNITLGGKTGTVLAVGNATWNATCSSAGCYTFSLTTPSAAGNYILAVSLNYSSEVQTVHRIISVTSTSLSAVPGNQEGQLKERFGTTDAVYVSLSAKNDTSSVNVTDVLVESVLYENGTKSNYTQVGSWSIVNSTNSVLEWAWNGSAQRLKLDAPTVGGNYLINVFVNNRSAAASTKFTIKPYTVCGAAKSTAGSVDSSSSFYVWQYKTTDTVYLELKVSQAQNAVGRAKAENSSFSSAYYGMGSACNIDTTKTQAITNATIVVESVVNLRSGTSIAVNASASTCSADDNSGAYTCTVKPLTKWDGGRYSVKMKVTGQDGQTVDKAEGVFEARAFYIWAYSNSWVNKPASNITFNVQMYEAGTNWWSNLGSTGGLTGEVTIDKVEYNGKDGEWIWPPIDIGYNTTGLNTSNISNGRGSFTLETSRLPKGRWDPGYYAVTIKGTNTATGDSDYGQAWLGIKQWETYSSPVEASGSSYRYKDSFGTKENVTLFVRITSAGDYSDSGGTSLAAGGNVSVGVKKLQYNNNWIPTELNTTAYSVQKVNVSTSSPWYYSANPSSASKYVMTISPTSGKWDGGYYNVVLDVNGTETGYGYFNIIAFSVDTQPTNASGSYTYTTKGNGPVYFNITTTKNKKLSYSYYGANDYINTTVKKLVLRTWLEGTWEKVEYNYPTDLNISPLAVNGTALLVVNKTGNWPGGYYSGEITMQDADNTTSTGYMWFSVRSFRVDTSVSNYNVDSDSNVTVNLNVRQPDWSNSNLVFGNYTVTSVYEDTWSSAGRGRTSYTNYRPGSAEWFNATTQLNISPSGTWGSGSYGGYHYLNVIVRDNADNTTQTGWVSFRAVPFSVTVGTVGNQYSFSQTNNVSVAVSVNKSVDKSAAIANLSRAFENTYPTQTTYGFAVGNCTSAANGTACQVNGTRNVTLVAPAGGWSSGWHYIYLEFKSPNGLNTQQADNSAYFNAVQAYDGSFSNYDEGGMYKYYYGLAENITIKIIVRDSNYAPQQVNITKVEMSEDGSSCWSESCKTYGNYSYQVLNGSGGNEIKGNGTIRILNTGAWQRGQHSIKATIQGSAGTAVIKTGYVYVKDTSTLNATIVSPQNGQVINSTSFMFNATTNKEAKCGMSVVNYDRFSQWYCYGGDVSGNATSPACNSTRFNGSTEYYQYVNYPPWGPMNTGGNVHYYNFSTDGWTNQDYGIQLSCNDADWNSVWVKVSFKLNGSVSSIPVKVNLSSPANNAVVNTSAITFVHNLTGPASSNINCTLYLNLSNTWAANTTKSVTLGNATNITTSNITVSGFNNGTYIWNTYCYQTTNTTNAAWAAINSTFVVAVNSTSNASNTTSALNSTLNVTLTSPANGSTANTSLVVYGYNFATAAGTANCSLYTNTTGSWALNKTNSSAGANAQSFSNTNINTGYYVWNVYCANATTFDWADSNSTFSAVSNTTQIAVAVNLSSPANTSITNTSSVAFGYNASGPSSMSCALWNNRTGSWQSRITNSSAVPGQQQASEGSFGNGYYIWNARCEDNTNSSNFGWGLNYTFTAVNVTSSIAVNLSSPANNSNANASTITFIYNTTAISVSSLNCTIWGNFTGAWAANFTNSSLTPANNIMANTTAAKLNLSAGDYLWNTRCNSAADDSVFGWATFNWTFKRNSS